MADEILPVKTGSDWISKLWVTLERRRERYQTELNEINRIMFGDPMDLAECYVEPDCQDRNPADRTDDGEILLAREPLMKKIDQFFQMKNIARHGGNQMFILSDAGMGKSALLTMLKLMHLTAFWPSKRECVLKKLGENTLDEINGIKNQVNTILLLDSIDEDPTSYGRVKERLLEILHATQHFFRVMVTCRTQFFPNTDADSLYTLGMVSVGPFSCHLKYLSYFTDDQVLAYLAKRYPKKWKILPNTKKIAEAKAIIDKMGSLRCRPMLLSYIEDLRNSSLIQSDACEYKIYDALVQNWLRREQIKKPEISTSDLMDACVILATVMFQKGRRSISETELNLLIETISKVRLIKEVELKGRALLNRNSDGDYRFSHFTIQEFCVAKLLLEKPILKPVKKIPLTDFIFRMIVLSKKAPNYMEWLDFKKLKPSNADLKGLKLSGADLKGLDFTGSDLREADLGNADLANANFSKADIRGTNLKDAIVTGASFEDAIIARIKLRDTPKTLSDTDVRDMIRKHDFFCKKHDWSKKWANESGDFKNKFSDNGDGTVTDLVTGLMWQKAGSENEMSFSQASDYVYQMNQNAFAGQTDWRLPTLEELMSLLENEKKNGDLYIDSVFGKNQRWCWSSDKRAGGDVWSVSFKYGSVNWNYENDDFSVRLVRRGQ